MVPKVKAFIWLLPTVLSSKMFYWNVFLLKREDERKIATEQNFFSAHWSCMMLPKIMVRHNFHVEHISILKSREHFHIIFGQSSVGIVYELH